MTTKDTLLSEPPHLLLIGASILAADFGHLAEECRAAIAAGADLLHLDVMDGHFVPNLTMGPDLCRSIRVHLPGVFLDVHMMVSDPGRFVTAFAEAGADLYTVHLEAAEAGAFEPEEMAQTIRAAGMAAGLAINPPTDVRRIVPDLDAYDLILVMSVNPGYAGQAFIGDVLTKAEAIKPRLRSSQRLQIDGGVSATTAASCRSAGFDCLVAASAIYKTQDYADSIRRLRGEA